MRVSLFLYCRKIRRFCCPKGLAAGCVQQAGGSGAVAGGNSVTRRKNSVRIIQNLVMTFSPVWGTMLYKVPIISQEEPNFEEAL